MVKLDLSFLYRKKLINDEDLAKSDFSRVLGLLDITAIGISSTLGSGIYVLSGTVISKYSGPSIVLSFLLAGLATFFSGLCYAELGARVPKSGSAYIYIYVTFGELLGFIMGWNLILEYILGTASVGNALSQYINLLSENRIRSFLLENFPMHVPGLGEYPDILALALVLFVTCFLIIGVKESTLINKIFTVLNVTILLLIIMAGATQVDFNYWKIDTENLSWIDVNNKNQSCPSSARCGDGGFLPFGMAGIINGAAKCFYAFIGFDVIASAGEEAKNPKRNIPLSILLTLIIVASLYCGMSSVLTLMIPYYLLDPSTPLTHAFAFANLNWAKYFVTIGAVTSLSTCLYAGLFPMPRIVYAMAKDGLIFKFLAKILPKLKTPFIASIVTGFLAALLSAMFNLDELVDMMSIGTLMAYTLVSICVLLLRYRPSEKAKRNSINKKLAGPEFSYLNKILKPGNDANSSSFRIVFILTLTAISFIIGLCFAINNLNNILEWYAIVIFFHLIVGIIACGALICIQPEIRSIKTFKVPFSPFLPLLSIFINVMMMMTLSSVTWARFLIWTAIGLIVYCLYGLKNSVENKKSNKQLPWFPCIIAEDLIEPVETTKIKCIAEDIVFMR